MSNRRAGARRGCRARSARGGGGLADSPRAERRCGRAIVLLAALLAGASGAVPADGGSRPAASADATHSFTDVLGQRVAWSAAPGRIVSLSPSLTEILFAIGADTTAVVGVTRFCDWPPEVAGVARIGGIVDPSLEAIQVLRPDLVLATRGNPRELMESLRALSIPVYALETRGELGQLFATIEEIGRVTGRVPAATALAGELRTRLAAVTARTGSLAVEGRPRVYFGELEGAHWTAGPGSYVDGLIIAAGGRNVAAAAERAWVPLSLETIVACDPEVLLGTFAGPDTPRARAAAEGRVREQLRALAGWRETSLGRRPRLFLAHEDILQRPGPRLLVVLEAFARFLHPQIQWGAPGPEER